MTNPNLSDIVEDMSKPFTTTIVTVGEIETDPRPNIYGSGRHVVFECGHENWLNATMTYRPGSPARCYHPDHGKDS